LILSLVFCFFEASVLSWQAACSRVTIYDPSGVVSAVLHERCRKPQRERERERELSYETPVRIIVRGIN